MLYFRFDKAKRNKPRQQQNIVTGSRPVQRIVQSTEAESSQEQADPAGRRTIR